MSQCFSAPPSAHLAQGAVVIPFSPDRLSDSDICEHYIGTIQSQDGVRSAHIKILRDKALANELIAATLGRALGVPVPDFFLLEIAPEDYEYFAQSSVLAKRSEPHNSKAFALATIEPRRDWSDFVGFAWQRLNKWVQSDKCDLLFLMHAVLFDEWVLNSDRNPTNFQVDSKNKLWAIDHESCFTGDRWEVSHLKTQQNDLNEDNELAQELRQCLRDANLLTLAREYIDPFVCSAAKLPLHTIILANSGNNRLSKPERMALKSFLEHRLGLVEALIHQHLDLPYQRRML